MLIKLSEIKDTKPIRNHGDIKALVDNIKKEGLLQPMVVNQNNELICGRRRYEAIKFLGWKEAEVYQIKTADDIDKLSKTIAENIHRKQLTWQEEVETKRELDKLMREKWGEQPRGKHRSLAGSANDGWSQEKTAQLLNEPRKTTQTDIQLANAIKEHPHLEKIKTKQGALRELKLIKQKEKIKTLKSPEGLYDVIVIDPPWETISNQEWEYHPKGRRCVPAYPTMSIQQIQQIQLPANKDCILWLWTINSRLHDAIHIIESWGFERKNILTWAKDKIGLGEWLRGQTEHCILATKGKPVFDGKKYSTLLFGKRTSHSTKPDEFYSLVENTCFGKKLDYFARKKRKGWAFYGDEV